MANEIRLKRGSGSDPSASDLVVGELAIRTDSGKIFTKKDNGTVAEISGGGGLEDGDKGDITVSNGGDTFTIDNGVVTSAKIADGTIVNADISGSAAIDGSKLQAAGLVNAGSMSAANFNKLAGIEANATADMTGTEILATISGENIILGEIASTGNSTFAGNITMSSSDGGSSAAPELDLYRISASPADSDYLGQIKFSGEDAADNKQIYAKITGKIGDATNTTEDGILEFMLIKNGSNNIAARFTSTDLKLINGTGLEVAGNISCDGTIDGVDIAARNTLFGGLTSSSGVLSNGVTATTQSASDNSTKVATTAYTDTAIANLVDSAPGTLNTLNELAAALGDDANFSTTVTNSLATKLPLAGGTLSGDLTVNGVAITGSTTNLSTGNLASSTQLAVVSLSGNNNFVDLTILGGRTGRSMVKFGDQDNYNVGSVQYFHNDNSINFFTNGGTTSHLTIASNGAISVSGTVDGRDLATDGSKLDGIESNATADQTASEILTLIKTVDGAGSGLDADTLDGISSASFVRSDAADTCSGKITFSDGIVLPTTGDGIKFGPGDAANDDAHIEWLGGSNTGYLRISTSDDSDSSGQNEYIEFGDYPNVNKNGTFTQHVRIARDRFLVRTGSNTISQADRLNIASDGKVDIYGNLEVGNFLRSTNGYAVGSTTVISQSRELQNVTLNSSSVTATTQSAGNNTTRIATTAFVSTAINNLINGAPAALDTLNELAAAMNDNASFSTTVTNSLATKMPLAGGQFTGNITFSGSQTVDGRDLSVDGSKLDGIESGATADQSASEILTLIKTVDGAGSGLDADTLDGISSGSFLRSDANDSASGTLNLNGKVVIGNSLTRPSALDSDADAHCRIGGSDVYLYVASLGAGGGYKLAMQAARASDFASFTLNLQSNGGNLERGGNKVWDAGNDGSGSGLDSDLLDGQQGSYYLNYNNFSNTPTIPTNNNQLTNGAGYVTANTQLSNEQVQDIVGGMVSGNSESGITVTYQDSDGTIDFSVASQTDQNFTTALKNKLDGIAAGATNVTNNNQLTNGAGYITSQQTNASNLSSGTLPAARLGTLPRRIGLNTTPGNTPNSRNAFLALGDSDTGVAQNGDGQLEFWANNQEIMNLDTGEIEAYKKFIPSSNNSIDLGSSSRRWANLYVNDMHFSNEGKTNDVDGSWGDWTLQEGEENIFMINNRSGKKFKIAMIPV